VNYGGVTFAPGDPNLLLIGGGANTPDGEIYGIRVKRGSDGYIVGFEGDAVKLYDAPHNDGGIVYHGSGVLFVSQWPVNRLAQLLPGSSAPDKVIDLAPLGVANSHAALLIPRQSEPGFGTIKLVSWAGGQWYEAQLVPDGSGTFDLVNLLAVQSSNLTTGPEGMAFVPAGSVFFDGDQILVAEYSVNTVSAYRVDASGNPIPASRRVMMTGLSGAVGSAIDPLTGDFVFSTFRQSHQVAIIRGFNAPSPIEPGLKDWVIYIDENNSGAREPWERSTRTAPDGSYEFVGLPPGSYIVREEPQTGWDQTFPALNPGSGSHVINVAAGQVVSGIDFLNEQGGVSKNTPPRFTSQPPSFATATSPLRYDARAVSDDHRKLEHSLINRPTGMTIHPALGTLIWQPTADQVGEHQVVIRVKDDQGGTALQQFTLVVARPNSAPVITSQLPARGIAGRTLSQRLDAQDADGDALSFTLVGAPAGMTIEPVQVRDPAGQVLETFHQLRWDVPQDATGSTYALALRVTDGRGGESAQSWSLEVLGENSANTPPVFASTPGKTARLGRVWGYLPAAGDPDGDAITFSIVQGPVGMAIAPSGVISWVPPAGTPSAVTVSIRASDGRGGQATQAFELMVTATEQNSAPIITSVPPARAIDGAMFRYDPVAVDADSDLLTWGLEVAPRGMSIDPQTGKIRWVPDDSQIGSHDVAVTVADPALGKFTQRFKIEVACVDLPPAILSVPPTTGLTSRPYLYAPRAIDPEGGSLAWSLAAKPQGMTIDSRTGVIRWTPASGQVGSHDVTIEVTDGMLVGRQVYRVVVSDVADDAKANRPPLITSTPRFAGESGLMYQYRVIAIDPDGDILRYELNRGPVGMTIGPDGLVSWDPSDADVGEHLIGVTVSDPSGAIATQGFLLSIKKNQPPVITSKPVLTAVAGSTYRYTVIASDPEGDRLTYRLAAAPQGMTIDPLGRILWSAPTTSTTPQSVTVVVSDDRGQTATQSYAIDMLADTEPPKVRISISAAVSQIDGETVIDVGSFYLVQVIATDNVAVSQTGLLVNGQPVTLSATGSVTLSASAVGTVQLLAYALDPSGLRGEAASSVKIVLPGESNKPVPTDPTLPPHPGFDPTDDGEPIVQITSPATGASVTNRVSIVGTVDDPEDNLWYYRAFYARADRVSTTSVDLSDPDWVLFKESTREVINGELALFDASELTNDPYAIVVAGFDVNGRGYAAASVVFVEGNVIVGNFRLDFTDLRIPLAGMPIEVTRVYDTLNAEDEGDFGYGWMLGVQEARIFEAGAIGVGGAFNGGDDKFVPDRTKVYMTNPAGKRVGFTYKEEYVGGAAFIIGCAFGCFYRPYFEADPGVYDTLTIDETEVARGGVLGALTQGINPEYYTLTTKEGMAYRYHEDRGLEKVTDRNGNVLTYGKDGIKHSLGEEVRFVRDHRGRIKEIIAPDGTKLTYEYDAAGDLVRYADQGGLVYRYDYLARPAHYLDSAFDPLGKRVMKAEYDAENRFIGVIDALGNRVDRRDFDTANNTGIIRDGNGNATTLIYDDRGNVVEEIDPQGNKTIRRYEDPRNPDMETTVIDRRGMVTERAYDERGNLLAVKEKGSMTVPLSDPVTTSFVYNSLDEVVRITNARGESTLFDYDSQGNLVRLTNAFGDSSKFTYDSQGRRTSFTDFNGNTTLLEHHAGCACGAPSKIVYPDGTYQTYEYNDFGLITLEQTFEANGTLVERRQTEYDSLGRATRELIGGGNDPKHSATDVRRFYNGQLLSWEIVVNPASLDVNGQLLESTATPVSQRKSRITEYRYDARDQLITRIDALGGVIDYRYDAQGNRVLLRDPMGNITTWVYDSLNRVIEERDPFYWVDFVAANSTSNGAALLVAVVEENKKLSTASLAANRGAPHVRAFGYDAEGNLAKLIDRNNRRREFAYDHADRLLEERWYNPVGQATAAGELVETIGYSYDAVGNMLTAVDSKSRYRHTYDSLNRLVAVDNNPLNDRNVPRVILSHAYDAHGGIISSSDDTGVTVASEYDSRNRLKIRRWFDASVPTGSMPDVSDTRVDYQYTAAGREREIKRYSNLAGTDLVGRTVQTYDLSGRTDVLSHTNAVDAVFAGYDYDYDFSGLLVGETRRHQDDRHAQEIRYGYDLTGQLIEALFEKQDDEKYRYDLNGNRQQAQVGSESLSYATGPANQILSDGTFTYTYDGEGNRLTKVRMSDGQVTKYVWDHRNRLVEVQAASREGVVMSKYGIGYDALNRKTIESSVGGEEVRTIHDQHHHWASARLGQTGFTRYLFGDRIDSGLAEQSGGTDFVWYHSDMSDSIRVVTDRDQLIKRTVEYSAFGEVFGAVPERGDLGFAFAGRQLTLDGELYDARSRYFDSSVGRFASEDSLRFRAGDTNLSRYVFNSPANFSDPSGGVALLEYELLLNSPHNRVAFAFIGFMHGFANFTFNYLGEYLNSTNCLASLVVAESKSQQTWVQLMRMGAGADAGGDVSLVGAFAGGVGVSDVADYTRYAGRFKAWGLVVAIDPVNLDVLPSRGGFKEGYEFAKAFIAGTC
jgi:RHS repeat-associated protein